MCRDDLLTHEIDNLLLEDCTLATPGFSTTQKFNTWLNSEQLDITDFLVAELDELASKEIEKRKLKARSRLARELGKRELDDRRIRHEPRSYFCVSDHLQHRLDCFI